MGGYNGASRPQIVLLHGLTGSRRLFAALEERLRGGPLSANTLSFDLPGFGENKGLQSTYAVSDQLRFITNSIEKRFPSGRVVLIGHSLGGVLALAWTLLYPQRVSKIVLMNTPLGDSREEILHSLLKDRFGWGALLLRHKHLAHFACITLRGAQFIRAFRFAKPPYVSEEVFRDYTQHTWTSLTRTFDNILLRTPGGPLLRQIRDIPILHITGRDDEALFRKPFVQQNTRHVILEGGHLTLLEHPEPAIQAIEVFLGADYRTPDPLVM